MKSNFKDITTGIHYHVTGYRYLNGKWVDGEGEQLMGVDKPLISVPISERQDTDNHIVTSLTIGYNPGARDKDLKGIREIAKRYDKSDEARHIAAKNAKKQLSKM